MSTHAIPQPSQVQALTQLITDLLAAHPAIRLGILFGSLATGRNRGDSDIDIAVAAGKPLTVNQKMALIGDLAQLLGRPVDLIDLQVTRGPLFRQILTRGRVIYCSDRALYGDIIRTMLFYEADMTPYYERILTERRQRWLAQ
jgi:predicted nucleotidyltransferase